MTLAESAGLAALSGQLASSYATTYGGHEAGFDVRTDTNDGALVAGILAAREYPFERMQGLSGWVIDVGAHIGIVSVALALDNPDIRIVAIEAIGQNAELVRRNVARNGVADRVFVETAGASAPGLKTIPITYGYEWVGIPDQPAPVVPQGYVRDSRFIGNIFEYPDGQQAAFTEQVPALSLDAVIGKYAMDDVALLKTDCEGCEYDFLASPAIKHVARIIGEYHRRYAPIEKLLRKTHTVTMLSDNGGVGLFEAVRT